MLALMIESTLRYSEAVSLVAEAADYFDADGQMVEAAQTFQAFADWAQS
jgi:hypothetical protein